jgi:hypothetical protein
MGSALGCAVDHLNVRVTCRVGSDVSHFELWLPDGYLVMWEKQPNGSQAEFVIVRR